MIYASKSVILVRAEGAFLAFIFFCVLASVSYATVFEYDGDGNLSITETKNSKPAARSPSLTNTSPALRALSREVALKHSGATGVRKVGLDALTFVDVFEALIQRESDFDPTAVSEKGAMGLGQLMPDTAADLKVSDPFDPHQNLDGSIRYFTQQLERFGSLELALAAYNAGPNRVKEYGDVPPFEETKQYIAWIFNKVGLETETPKPVQASVPSRPKNKEEPLKGEVSVWEY